MSSAQCTPAPAASPLPRVGDAAARSWTTPLELLVLGVIWGASFLFMRVAARDFGPLALVEVRLALGALVLLPFLWRDRARFPLRLWPRLALIGALNSGIPFLLFAWGAERAPAAIGAICNATTVLFTALVGFLCFGEKIGTRRALALLIGFAGVVVLATAKSAGAGNALAVAAGTLAAVLYGVGANLVRRQLTGLPPASAAAATLSMASLMLLPFAATHWPSQPIPAASWWSAIGLGVLCTGLAFLLYYRLIQRIGAPRAATVTYLVPLFGASWAWLLLDEALTLPMLVAGAMILGSVAISQRAKA